MVTVCNNNYVHAYKYTNTLQVMNACIRTNIGGSDIWRFVEKYVFGKITLNYSCFRVYKQYRRYLKFSLPIFVLVRYHGC